MVTLLEQLCVDDPTWLEEKNKLVSASSLVSIVTIAWLIGLQLARTIVQQELGRRAKAPTQWPDCPHCKKRLHSKGFEERRILTLVGEVQWSRRVGRCPNSCPGSQKIPFDEQLKISSYQQTSTEVIRLGCLLAVFVPFEITAQLLENLTGIKVCPQTIWNWVQEKGQQAMEELASELKAMKDGFPPITEPLCDAVAQMTLAVAADGVMVPFRSREKTPKGQIQWREVKVAVFARLGHDQTRDGQTLIRLQQRRLVAVLGDINQLRPRLMLEAIRCGLHTAPQVVWLSDGGRGFWNLYTQCLAQLAVIGVLDFYHAAGHLWQAAAAYLDGRTRAAKEWFKFWRHQLRHGNSSGVITELKSLINSGRLSGTALYTLTGVHDYLNNHKDHIKYQEFESLEIPRGSGMVESACKWLIQQRFKGVGMRWDTDGFNHLLHLRLAWVNGRFDQLFFKDNFSFPSGASPND